MKYYVNYADGTQKEFDVAESSIGQITSATIMDLTDYSNISHIDIPISIGTIKAGDSSLMVL